MKLKLAFFTSSRADYGKIKEVIKNCKNFDYKIIITGSHLLKEYGHTVDHIKKDFPDKRLIKFRNQVFNDNAKYIYEKTTIGLNKILNKNKFDLAIIHGDRVETLAAASIFMINRIKIAHIEGGELSGTIDEMIRHAISKMSNIHFVTNNVAKKVLINSGEQKKNIYVTGSPDIDILKTKLRPDINAVKKRYKIPFKEFSISFLHPITTEGQKSNDKNSKIYFKSLKASNKQNFIQFVPNNDDFSKIIFKNLKNILSNCKNVKILPSMRFEYYLTLLEHSKFIIGNSSSAIMEAPYFGVPAINVGKRQINRYGIQFTKNINFSQKQILRSIQQINRFKLKKKKFFGNGESAKKIIRILNSKKIKNIDLQKNYKNLILKT